MTKFMIIRIGEMKGKVELQISEWQTPLNSEDLLITYSVSTKGKS